MSRVRDVTIGFLAGAVVAFGAVTLSDKLRKAKSGKDDEKLPSMGFVVSIFFSSGLTHLRNDRTTGDRNDQFGGDQRSAEMCESTK